MVPIVKRVTGLILLLIIAAVFLFSGISKLYSFEGFVWNIIDAGLDSFGVASIIARLLISFEILLGVFLLAHIYLRSFTYPASIGLLAAFTIYLVILVVKQGNTGDCGCFGEAYAMKPVPGIIKNIAMMAGLFFLRWLYPVRPYKNQEWIAAIIGMVAIVLPFIFYPMSGDDRPTKVHEPINMDALYSAGNNPGVELRQGKHIVSFMSLGCPHCRRAARYLAIIHNQHPKDISLFLVLAGPQEEKKEFFEDTKAEGIPHMFFTNTSEFMKMSGPGVPAIYWINNSIIEMKSNYYQLDPALMMEWMNR